MRALLKKNWQVQKKQKGTNICQIITPLLVLLILFILQLVIKSQISDVETTNYVPTVPFPLNIPVSSGPNLVCWKYFLYSYNSQSVQPPGFLTENGTSSGLLSHIGQDLCNRTDNANSSTQVYVPAFEIRDNLTQMNQEIFADLLEYNKYDLNNLTLPPIVNLLPDGLVYFDNIDPSNAIINFTLSVNDNSLRNYHRQNNFTRVGRNIIVTEGKLALFSMVTQAFTAFSLFNSSKPFPVSDSYLNLRFTQKLPYYSTLDLLAIIALSGVFLFPIALSIQL